MNRVSRHLGFLCFLCCLHLLILGCWKQDYPGDQRFPLSGKVSYDGTPIDLGTISFLPQSGDKQRVSGGMIENGAYSVIEAQGANAGLYRIEIRWAKKTGKQRFDRELDMMVDIRNEGLPPKFHTDSQLTVEVSKDQHVFDFDLMSK